MQDVSVERRATRGGKPIDLTAKEFSLLEFFVLHHGQVVDRAAITAHVWDENHDPFTNVLGHCTGRLIQGGRGTRPASEFDAAEVFAQPGSA